MYKNLSYNEKSFFYIGVRDLFIASCRYNLLNGEEIELLNKLINMIDINTDRNNEDNFIINVNNSRITPYPNKSNILVRYFDEINSFYLIEFFIHTKDVTKFFCLENFNALIKTRAKLRNC